MPDPILDDSTPCCRDFSRLIRKLLRCATGPKLDPGATGGLGSPTPGSWSNSLNATGGGGGGATGGSYVVADPSPGESWS